MHNRFSLYRAKGLTLIEFVIALSLVIFVIGVAVSQMNSKQHKAEQVIAQMQLAKTGMLRFNMDYPCSASGLSALVKREDALTGGCGAANDAALWKGPYIEVSTPLADDNINISGIYIDSFLELRQETIGNTFYQAIVLSGTASSELRTAIMEQCGNDCQPLPGRSDIGILVNQVSFANPGDPTELAFMNAVPKPHLVLPPMTPSWSLPSTPGPTTPVTTGPTTPSPSGTTVPPVTTPPVTTPPVTTPPVGPPPVVAPPPDPVVPVGPGGPPQACQTTTNMRVSDFLILQTRNARSDGVGDTPLMAAPVCPLSPLDQTDPPNAKIQACIDRGPPYNAIQADSAGTCTTVIQDVPWNWAIPAAQLQPWTAAELTAFCRRVDPSWACAQ